MVIGHSITVALGTETMTQRRLVNQSLYLGWQDQPGLLVVVLRVENSRVGQLALIYPTRSRQ